MNRKAQFTTALALATALLAVPFALHAGAKAAAPKDIVDTAVAAGSFKTLATALGAAGLVDTLKGKGPFTVFAPTDEAFAKLPAGTDEALLKDKAKLTKILTYHVVAGKWSSVDLKKMIKKGKGNAELTTVAGGKLWAMMDGNTVVLKDEKGGISRVTQANVFQSNGVIHVVDSVVLPN